MSNNSISSKQRNLGLDLLRIISMFMIIILHCIEHGGVLEAAKHNTNIYISILILKSLCLVCVNVFIIISGYYLSQQDKIRIKKVISLWEETFFYSITIYLIVIIWGIESFNIKGFLTAMFPILLKQYWFISVYIGLYVLSPYINKIIRNISKKELFILILIIVMMFSLSNFLPIGSLYYSNKGSSLAWFIVLYIIGAYIKLIENKLSNNKLIYLIIYFIMCISGVLIGVLLQRIGMSYFSNVGLQYNSINILIASIAIFILFLLCNNFKGNYIIKAITRISFSTFAIYLIHDNSNIRNYLYFHILKLNNLKLNFSIIFNILFYAIIILFASIFINTFKVGAIKLIKNIKNNFKLL